MRESLDGEVCRSLWSLRWSPRWLSLVEWVAPAPPIGMGSGLQISVVYGSARRTPRLRFSSRGPHPAQERKHTAATQDPDFAELLSKRARAVRLFGKPVLLRSVGRPGR